MPATSPCNPCCSETVVTNTPGAQGDDGVDGSAGANAYTVTTATFVIPAVNSNVTISVSSSAWMAVGQIVVVAGPVTLRVVSLPTALSATLKNLGYNGDLAVGATVASASTVSPGGACASLSSLTVYASGTAYSLTATAALLSFGTTTPSLIITSAGTWLILSRVRYDYVAATFAASQTVTTALRRTNNTAADIKSSQWTTDIITTLTYTAHFQPLPPVIYTTTNADDVLQLYGSIGVVPGAGALKAVEAEIVAVKIS